MSLARGAREKSSPLAARTIKSPVAGKVAAVLKNVGEYVSPADPVVAKVVVLHPLRATFFLPRNTAQKLARGRSVSLVLPRLGATALDNLLNAAHTVDGIVKGLKSPGWPTDPWQALHRLAMQLCQECVVQQGQGPRAKIAA